MMGWKCRKGGTQSVRLMSNALIEKPKVVCCLVVFVSTMHHHPSQYRRLYKPVQAVYTSSAKVHSSLGRPEKILSCLWPSCHSTSTGTPPNRLILLDTCRKWFYVNEGRSEQKAVPVMAGRDCLHVKAPHAHNSTKTSTQHTTLDFLLFQIKGLITAWVIHLPCTQATSAGVRV